MSDFGHNHIASEINDGKFNIKLYVHYICHTCLLSSHVKHIFETCLHRSCPLCLTYCLQLRRDKLLLIWKQFSICIICPVHGAFTEGNRSHKRRENNQEKRVREANRDLRQQWRVAEESP